MTLPALLFGFLVATLLGAAFHLWRGGSLGRLLLYLIFAWAGFWIGHFVGDHYGLKFASVGPLRLGAAVIFSIVTLFGGYWLSLINQEAPQKYH
jgi:hypothetical protein